MTMRMIQMIVLISFFDEDGMYNYYQDNNNNNEHINGRRILIDEEVYDEIGIGG